LVWAQAGFGTNAATTAAQVTVAQKFENVFILALVFHF